WVFCCDEPGLSLSITRKLARMMGRRRDRGKRSGQGFDLYGASTGRTRKIGSRLRAANPPRRDVLFLLSRPEAREGPTAHPIQNRPRRLRRIKALDWQTPARGSFDPQRFSGALANHGQAVPPLIEPKDKPAGPRKRQSLAETCPESDIRRPSEPGEDDEREH